MFLVFWNTTFILSVLFSNLSFLFWFMSNSLGQSFTLIINSVFGKEIRWLIFPAWAIRFQIGFWHSVECRDQGNIICESQAVHIYVNHSLIIFSRAQLKSKGCLSPVFIYDPFINVKVLFCTQYFSSYKVLCSHSMFWHLI